MESLQQLILHKKKIANTNKNNYACVQVRIIFTNGANKRHISKFKKKSDKIVHLPYLFSMLPNLGKLFE